jgi:probable HAF family extracellular repeat protein
MTDLKDIISGNSYAQGINNKGQVVGYYYSNRERHSHPFLYDKGQVTDLATLVALEDGWNIEMAVDINDHGQIVAHGYKASGVYHALLLTPTVIPLPGAATLFVSSWLVFLGLRRQAYVRLSNRRKSILKRMISPQCHNRCHKAW